MMSVLVYSQDFYHAIAVSQAYWQGNRWVWDDHKPINLTFTVQRNIILVDDEAHSVYRLQDNFNREEFRDYRHIMWNARDERNRYCVIKIVQYKDGDRSQLYVLYSQVAFCYTIDYSD